MNEILNIRVKQSHPAQLNASQTSTPRVRVIRYNPVERTRVQAFVDIEIDGILRLNGLHLMRDGSIEAAKLTPLVRGRRAFIPAIEILDPGLLESMTTAILVAIQAHLQTLPPTQQVKPRQTSPRPQPSPAKQQHATATLAEIARAAARAKQPSSARPLAVPPPSRLMIGFSRRTQ
jgi:hypothetical protein